MIHEELDLPLDFLLKNEIYQFPSQTSQKCPETPPSKKPHPSKLSEKK